MRADLLDLASSDIIVSFQLLVPRLVADYWVEQILSPITFIR